MKLDFSYKLENSLKLPQNRLQTHYIDLKHLKLQKIGIEPSQCLILFFFVAKSHCSVKTSKWDLLWDLLFLGS